MTRRIISVLNSEENMIIKGVSEYLHTSALKHMTNKMMASTSIPISIRRLRNAVIAFM
jgi:hypothetical protein